MIKRIVTIGLFALLLAGLAGRVWQAGANSDVVRYFNSAEPIAGLATSPLGIEPLPINPPKVKTP